VIGKGRADSPAVLDERGRSRQSIAPERETRFLDHPMLAGRIADMPLRDARAI